MEYGNPTLPLKNCPIVLYYDRINVLEMFSLISALIWTPFVLHCPLKLNHLCMMTLRCTASPVTYAGFCVERDGLRHPSPHSVRSCRVPGCDHVSNHLPRSPHIRPGFGRDVPAGETSLPSPSWLCVEVSNRHDHALPFWSATSSRFTPSWSFT